MADDQPFPSSAPSSPEQLIGEPSTATDENSPESSSSSAHESMMTSLSSTLAPSDRAEAKHNQSSSTEYVENLEAILQVHESTFVNLHKELEPIDSKIAELETRFEGYKHALARLQTTYELKKDKYKESNTLRKTMLDRKKKLEERLRTVRATSKILKDEEGAARDEFNAITESRDKLKADIDKLKIRKANVCERIAEAEWDKELCKRFPDPGARALAKKLGWNKTQSSYQYENEDGDEALDADIDDSDDGEFSTDLALLEEELIQVGETTKVEGGQEFIVPKVEEDDTQMTLDSQPAKAVRTTSTKLNSLPEDSTSTTTRLNDDYFDDDKPIDLEMVQKEIASYRQQEKRVQNMVRLLKGNGNRKRKSEGKIGDQG